MLITAGPTQEPIDAVRFIGNRSSGRVGIALAAEAAQRGWDVDLLLGPTALSPPEHPKIQVAPFRTTDDLQRILTSLAPAVQIVIMAAAVADFRPRSGVLAGKLPRGGSLTLELEPTPDLLAGLAASRSAGQLLIGFALQPRVGLVAAAKDKLIRKKVDMIVANPLETMDSSEIEAIVLTSGGEEHRTPGAIPKERFAAWLLDLITEHIAARKQES